MKYYCIGHTRPHFYSSLDSNKHHSVIAQRAATYNRSHPFFTGTRQSSEHYAFEANRFGYSVLTRQQTYASIWVATRKLPISSRKFRQTHLLCHSNMRIHSANTIEKETQEFSSTIHLIASKSFIQVNPIQLINGGVALGQYLPLKFNSFRWWSMNMLIDQLLKPVFHTLSAVRVHFRHSLRTQLQSVLCAGRCARNEIENTDK